MYIHQHLSLVDLSTPSACRLLSGDVVLWRKAQSSCVAVFLLWLSGQLNLPRAVELDPVH